MEEDPNVGRPAIVNGMFVNMNIRLVAPVPPDAEQEELRANNALPPDVPDLERLHRGGDDANKEFCRWVQTFMRETPRIGPRYREQVPNGGQGPHHEDQQQNPQQQLQQQPQEQLQQQHQEHLQQQHQEQLQQQPQEYEQYDSPMQVDPEQERRQQRIRYLEQPEDQQRNVNQDKNGHQGQQLNQENNQSMYGVSNRWPNQEPRQQMNQPLPPWHEENVRFEDLTSELLRRHQDLRQRLPNIYQRSNQNGNQVFGQVQERNDRERIAQLHPMPFMAYPSNSPRPNLDGSNNTNNDERGARQGQVEQNQIRDAVPNVRLPPWAPANGGRNGRIGDNQQSMTIMKDLEMAVSRKTLNGRCDGAMAAFRNSQGSHAHLYIQSPWELGLFLISSSRFTLTPNSRSGNNNAGVWNGITRRFQQLEGCGSRHTGYMRRPT